MLWFQETYSESDPYISNAVSQGVDVLNKYLDWSEEQGTATACILLNPRMKMQTLIDLGFTETQRDRAYQNLKRIYEDYREDYFLKYPAVTISSEDEDDDPDIAWMKSRTGNATVTSLPMFTPAPPGILDDELDRWLGMTRQQKGDHKTYSQYWKGMTTLFPVFQRMARDFGGILASSVASESVFSIAGLVSVRNRNRLAPKTMGIILLLRSWGCLPDEWSPKVKLEEQQRDEGRPADIRTEWDLNDLDEARKLADSGHQPELIKEYYDI